MVSLKVLADRRARQPQLVKAYGSRAPTVRRQLAEASPIVPDKPGKPEQITPAKTVTDTAIAPYIFFASAPNFGFANGVVNVTLAAVAKVAGARQHVLYVEFRKDRGSRPMVGRK